MTYKEKISSAWGFYVKNPSVIYMFLLNKRINDSELIEKLQDEPIKLSESAAYRMIDIIKENPLFIKKDNCYEIDQSIAKAVVNNVEKSFGFTALNDENKKLREELENERKKYKLLEQQYYSKDVVISDIRPETRTPLRNDEIELEPANKPLINGFKVPSIYNTATAKNNLCERKRNVEINISVLNEALTGIRRLLKKEPREIEKNRRELLKRLLDETDPVFSKRSSFQKLIYYLSIYPDITEQQKRNIFEACKSGLDARLLMELMETDEELFSAEYFDYMIEVSKSQAEAQIMVDLAKRLMFGEWYVSANVDGKPMKFMLRPVENIKSSNQETSNMVSQKPGRIPVKVKNENIDPRLNKLISGE